MYLDGGPCADGVASTIVDLTGNVPRLLRAGAVSVGRLREVAMLSTGGDVAPGTDSRAETFPRPERVG